MQDRRLATQTTKTKRFAQCDLKTNDKSKTYNNPDTYIIYVNFNIRNFRTIMNRYTIVGNKAKSDTHQPQEKRLSFD